MGSSMMHANAGELPPGGRTLLPPAGPQAAARASGSPSSSPVLSVRGVTKRFGATVALQRVDLDVQRGEIVGLLGENGAGKSTLVGVLSGILRSDAGEILVDGQPRAFKDAHDAQRCGIATVYQHLALAPHLDVAENLFLGRLGALHSVVNPGKLRRRAEAVLSDLGWRIEPRAQVRTLPTSDQQLVEVARAIASNVAVLLLDEPTSSLAPREVDTLMGRVRELARAGIAVIFVSHQLDEVFDLVDSFAILRDGQMVLRCRKSETGRSRVVRAMLGADAAQLGESADHGAPTSAQGASAGAPVLELVGLTRPGAFRDVSLVLRPGEVLAVTGLRGCGAVEVATALFAQAGVSGLIRCLGRSGPLSSAQLIRAGIGYVPADRATGLYPDLSLRENLSLTARVAGIPLEETVEGVIERLAIKARDSEVPVRSLSGGNQQKVLIGRWLLTAPRGLVLVEPTRGVDIRVRADIHQLIREAARDGMALLVASLDAEEIEAIADRVLVMHDGSVRRELHAPLTANAVLDAITQVASSRSLGT